MPEERQVLDCLTHGLRVTMAEPHQNLFYFICPSISQVKYPRCCNNEPEYLITYDCGPDPKETMLVCKDHFKEEPFQRFAVKIEKLGG